ncbi:uncharacterized protein EV422DRAFT_519471 [Fimicolochytrium jonesii]|uniref:uncharacterized protein n=1 Tax=Fimicolochytrium jonesii TaxID=1396493 RepID=UPI0022FDD8EB|nr:uncharacterized protein EV422DRAFT_519471 [Fimicolochytrium jonesii]KAI8824257.1 hypothetical protein EV422DRAFT_519471 [Fimicolochytrium jonesii]
MSEESASLHDFSPSEHGGSEGSGFLNMFGKPRSARGQSTAGRKLSRLPFQFTGGWRATPPAAESLEDLSDQGVTSPMAVESISELNSIQASAERGPTSEEPAGHSPKINHGNMRSNLTESPPPDFKTMNQRTIPSMTSADHATDGNPHHTSRVPAIGIGTMELAVRSSSDTRGKRPPVLQASSWRAYGGHMAKDVSQATLDRFDQSTVEDSSSSSMDRPWEQEVQHLQSIVSSVDASREDTSDQQFRRRPRFDEDEEHHPQGKSGASDIVPWQSKTASISDRNAREARSMDLGFVGTVEVENQLAVTMMDLAEHIQIQNSSRQKRLEELKAELQSAQSCVVEQASVIQNLKNSSRVVVQAVDGHRAKVKFNQHR